MNNRLFLGLGSISVATGTALSDIQLEVQGYYTGTVRFVSTCSDSTDSIRYGMHQKIPYKLYGTAQKSCGVGFVVSPEYPDEINQTVRVHSFEGYVWIKVLHSDEKWLSAYTRDKADQRPLGVISLPAQTEPVTVVFESKRCGIHYEAPRAIVNGQVEVRLSDVIPTMPFRVCVVEGAVVDTHGAIEVSWLIDGYAADFIPMAVPLVRVIKGTIVPFSPILEVDSHLEVQGDDSVSVIGLDAEYVINRTAKFSFDPKKEHTLRVLTTGGRLVIGQYEVNTGWTWVR